MNTGTAHMSFSRDVAIEYLGAEGLCEALAKAMGTDELESNLKYIFRVNDIPFGDDEEEIDEGCHGRKSKKRKSKKNEDLRGSNIFYIFVSLNELDAPEYHIVPSDIVADTIKTSHQNWLNTPDKKEQPQGLQQKEITGMEAGTAAYCL